MAQFLDTAKLLRAAALLALAGLPLVADAAAPANEHAAAVVTAPGRASPEDPKGQLLDEVLVEGTRLWKLRQQAVQVEDKFYALYNELNKDRDFAVHCHIETPTDRIIKERVCRVAYYENAQEVEVQALLDGHSAPPALMVGQAREADFEKHFLQVINSDPRLVKLARERDALGVKYLGEREQRTVHHRWFRFEK